MNWINVEERLPDVFAGLFLVKTQKGNEVKAFFYSDAMAWIAFYGIKTCYWWNSEIPHKAIYDVTHWLKSTD